jgi:hypothetical protein
MERLRGTVISRHNSSNPHLGRCFGEIQTPTGHLYVWSSYSAYGPCNLTLGAQVTFEPVVFSYADRIDSGVEKGGASGVNPMTHKG